MVKSITIVAAVLIGWQVSPFQFEVGMADLAIGVTAIVAFWRDLSFKAAAVCAASIFLLGDAVGHVHEMLDAGNFAPGNAGVPFYMDLIYPLLAITLLIIASRGRRIGGGSAHWAPWALSTCLERVNPSLVGPGTVNTTAGFPLC